MNTRTRVGLWASLVAGGSMAVAGLAWSAADTSAVASQLPDMGSGANVLLSRSDEYQIGRMIMRSMRDANEVLDDPEVSDYLQHLGSRLAAQTGTQTTSYHYFVVPDAQINAFALPGGFIGVNSGLMLLTKSESELASVMAHETAHVQQRHIARAIQAQSRNS